MKGKFCHIVLLGCLVFALAGCQPPPAEQMKDWGIFGEHAVARIENFSSAQGSLSGSFFLGFGSINGSSNSGFKFQFYWSPKPGEIIVTSLPYDKFRFIIDETKKEPTVEFVFNDFWLNDPTTQIIYKKKDYPNLNDIVMSMKMKLVIVRISKATLEKEIYLPKIR